MHTNNYTNLGGQPIDLDHLEKIQTANKAEGFAAMVAFIGDKKIISGCQVVGTTVSNGFITYNGEIFKFIGGTLAADVVIVETPTALIFDDLTSHEVEFERTATCGLIGTFPFNQLTTVSKFEAGDLKEIYCDNLFINTNFDLITGIGLQGKVLGWQILSIFAPATAGRVAVNWDPSSGSNFNAILSIGGSENHTLTIPEMPEHDHIGATLKPDEVLDANGRGFQPQNHNNTPAPTSKTGGGQSHNNMQPYYVILKLIKI